MALIKKYNFFLLIPLLLLCSCNKLSYLFSKKQIPDKYNTPRTPPPKVQKITAWNVETFYIIQDIHPDLGNRILEAVRTNVLINPTAIRKLSQEEIAAVSTFKNGFGFAIHPSEVSDLSKLSRIQDVVMDISEKEVVPLKLVNSILNFQSVSGDATSFTQIFGDAPPDSTIEVDDASGRLIKVYSDEKGKWDAKITQNDRLRARNGFVYIKISKGSAIQYIEMDLLSKKRRRINASDLPKSSILLY